MNYWLDIRDLEQAAALEALEADRAWHRAGNQGRNPWQARRVALALSRLVATTRSPVSVPDCRGKEGSPDRARWEAAAGAGRVPLLANHDSDCSADTPDVARKAVEEHEPLEDALDRAHTLATAVALLEARSEAARAVVLEGEKPAEVTARTGLTVRQVYGQACKAMIALRAALCDQGGDR